MVTHTFFKIFKITSVKPRKHFVINQNPFLKLKSSKSNICSIVQFFSRNATVFSITGAPLLNYITLKYSINHRWETVFLMYCE